MVSLITFISRYDADLWLYYSLGQYAPSFGLLALSCWRLLLRQEICQSSLLPYLYVEYFSKLQQPQQPQQPPFISPFSLIIGLKCSFAFIQFLFSWFWIKLIRNNCYKCVAMSAIFHKYDLWSLNGTAGWLGVSVVWSIIVLQWEPLTVLTQFEIINCEIWRDVYTIYFQYLCYWWKHSWNYVLGKLKISIWFPLTIQRWFCH